MCGITGLVTLTGEPAEAEVIEAMTDALYHRGPDDDGTYVEGSVALGFRRLAILDLTPTGHQPMTSPDGRYVMVYNGEIYNYVELREELQALGHSFRSTGDSEVLLRAYQEWGADCLSKLNGMWAFLIYDREKRIVFRSRATVSASSRSTSIAASGCCSSPPRSRAFWPATCCPRSPSIGRSRRAS